jgi:hypothetical protein
MVITSSLNPMQSLARHRRHHHRLHMVERRECLLGAWRQQHRSPLGWRATALVFTHLMADSKLSVGMFTICQQIGAE